MKALNSFHLWCSTKFLPNLNAIAVASTNGLWIKGNMSRLAVENVVVTFLNEIEMEGKVPETTRSAEAIYWSNVQQRFPICNMYVLGFWVAEFGHGLSILSIFTIIGEFEQGAYHFFGSMNQFEQGLSIYSRRTISIAGTGIRAESIHHHHEAFQRSRSKKKK